MSKHKPTEESSQSTAPATSPGILWGLASLVGLGGRNEEVPEASAASAPPALPDEPNSAVAGVDQSVVSASGSAPTGEPTVSAVEDREPPAPLQDVGLVPLPASSSEADFWEDASHLLLREGQSAAQAPATDSVASAPAPAPSGVFPAFAAGYKAGRNGEALPGVAPAAQAAPAQSTPSSTGILGRFTSALRISASNGAEASAAVAPSPSPSSSETPPVRRSISEALIEGYVAGSTSKPVTPPADTPSPADTASFVARLEGERAVTPPASSSLSI